MRKLRKNYWIKILNAIRSTFSHYENCYNASISTFSQINIKRK